MYVCIYARMYVSKHTKHIRTHKQTHTCTHARTHARTLARTHAHTHTRTQHAGRELEILHLDASAFQWRHSNSGPSLPMSPYLPPPPSRSTAMQWDVSHLRMAWGAWICTMRSACCTCPPPLRKPGVCVCVCVCVCDFRERERKGKREKKGARVSEREKD